MQRRVNVLVGTGGEASAAFALLLQQRIGALLVAADPYFDTRHDSWGWEQVIQLTDRRFSALSVEAGHLVRATISLQALWRENVSGAPLGATLVQQLLLAFLQYKHQTVPLRWLLIMIAISCGAVFSSIIGLPLINLAMLRRQASMP